MAEKKESTALQVVEQEFAVETADIERVLRNLKEANNGTINAFSLQQLRVPSGGGLAWVVGEKPLATVRGVIMHHHASRAYYDQPFGTAGTTGRPPTCQSADGITGYGTPGGDCVTCKLAQFGTKLGADGKPGRAPQCTNAHTVYVLFPDSRLPTVLKVPAASIQAFRDYCKQLALGETYGESYSPREVVTEFGLKQEVSADKIKYSQVTFKAVGVVRESLTQKLLGYGENLKSSLSRPMIAAPSAAQAQPMFTDVDDDDIPEVKMPAGAAS